MFCKDCGHELSAGITVCVHCHPEDTSESHLTYGFERKVFGLSWTDHKHTKTTAVIYPTTLALQNNTTWLHFVKRPPRDVTIPLSQITEIYQRHCWDTSEI